MVWCKRWLAAIVVLILVSGCNLLSPTASPPATPPAAPAEPTTAANPTEVAPTTAPPTTSVPPSPPVSSQPLSPLAPGDDFAFRQVSMTDGLHGWAIVDAQGLDHLLRTEDGGQTWQDVSPPSYPSTGDAAAAQMLGAFPEYRQAWVSYFLPDPVPSTATVWRTEHAGGDWAPAEPVSVPSGGVSFRPLLTAADATHGLYVADVIGADGSHQVTVFRTADGGETWQSTSIRMCQPTGVALAADGRAWLTESCLGGENTSAGLPGYWQSEDGGASWQGFQLDWPELGLAPPEESSSCRTDDPNLLASGGALAVNCFSDTDHETPTEHVVARYEGSWAGFRAPQGQLFLLDDRYGWKLDKMIYNTSDGGQNWSLINQVSWQGNFSFIDRWRGWAAAINGDENALVRTTDGGRSYELMETSLLPQPGSQPTAGCQLTVSGAPTVYTRPSYAAEPFGGLPGGMPLYLEAKTSDGWYGFDPGVAQAANIGVFHNRWLPPDSDVTMEGNCDDVPVVEGPLPGVCYEMVMGHAAVRQDPNPDATLLTTLTTGEYVLIRDQNADNWIQVDLGFGNVGLDLKGWMDPQDINWNGPCPPGG